MPTTPSHILAIEISNPGAGVRSGMDGVMSGPGVAIGRVVDGRVETLGVEWLGMVPTGQRGGLDDDLMPAMERLFARLGLKPRKCLRSGRVAVSIGPGGYTSLRIACAAGKMIAEAAGAQCVGVPTALALARAAAGQGHLKGGSPIAIALASKSNGAWVQMVGTRQDELGKIVTAADLGAMHSAGVRVLIADQHLPAAMRIEAEKLRIAVIEPVYTPVAVMELGAALPSCDPAELNPLYPREPDAVTLWRARKPV